MPWQQVGEFWGYGDRSPRFVVLVDSLFQLRSTAGWFDVSMLVYYCLIDALAIPSMVVAMPGARARRGDYRRMDMACQGASVDALLVISMGNDLLQGCVGVGAVAVELSAIQSMFPCVSMVYGGSASIWGYTNADYDKLVASICARLCCRDGSAELEGVQIGDAIGHLRPASAGQLCDAVVTWARAAMARVPIRARL